MMEFGAGIIVVIWLIFSFIWFKAVDAGDILGKLLLYIAFSIAIFIGGALLIAIMATSPIVSFVVIVIIVAFLILVVIQSDGFKNRQTMKGVTKHESAQQVSGEELLKKLSRVEKGQVIRFGAYDWKVLEVKEDRALLFVEQMVAIKKFNRSGSTWANCSLRKYLNGAFLRGSFSASEQALILETVVKNLGGCDYRSAHGFRKKPIPLSDTTDRIFLLSREEVEQYIPKEQRPLKVKSEAVYWWVRNTNVGNFFGDDACAVESGGAVYNCPAHMDCGVRPAMWVKTK